MAPRTAASSAVVAAGCDHAGAAPLVSVVDHGAGAQPMLPPHGPPPQNAVVWPGLESLMLTIARDVAEIKSAVKEIDAIKGVVQKLSTQLQELQLHMQPAPAVVANLPGKSCQRGQHDLHQQCVEPSSGNACRPGSTGVHCEAFDVNNPGNACQLVCPTALAGAACHLGQNNQHLQYGDLSSGKACLHDFPIAQDGDARVPSNTCRRTLTIQPSNPDSVTTTCAPDGADDGDGMAFDNVSDTTEPVNNGAMEEGLGGDSCAAPTLDKVLAELMVPTLHVNDLRTRCRESGLRANGGRLALATRCAKHQLGLELVPERSCVVLAAAKLHSCGKEPSDDQFIAVKEHSCVPAIANERSRSSCDAPAAATMEHSCVEIAADVREHPEVDEPNAHDIGVLLGNAEWEHDATIGENVCRALVGLYLFGGSALKYSKHMSTILGVMVMTSCTGYITRTATWRTSIQRHLRPRR